MSQQHIAPTLSYPQIISFLNELDVQTTEKQLKNPMFLDVHDIYQRILESVLEVEMSDLSQPKIPTDQIFEHPELHENSIKQLEFWKHLQQLMYAVGVHGFSITDLMAPDPTRLRAILSCVINFCKFREARLSLYNELKDQSEQLDIKQRQVEEEHKQVTDILKGYREQQAKDEPEVKKLERETNELQRTMQLLNKKQSDIHSENQTLKQTANKIAEQNKKDTALIEQLKQECETLRGQIVHSPEQLKQKIEDLTKTVETTKADIAADEKKISQVQLKLEEMKKAEQDIQKCLAILKECEGEIQKNKEINKELKQLQDAMENIKEEMAESKTNQSHLQRQIQSSEEKFDRLKKQQEQKIEALNLTIEDNKREKALLKKRAEDRRQKVDKNQQVIIELKQQIDKLVAQHNQEMQYLTQLYDSLEKQVKDYHKNLLKAMK